jgi:hypothetical protein
MHQVLHEDSTVVVEMSRWLHHIDEHTTLCVTSDGCILVTADMYRAYDTATATAATTANSNARRLMIVALRIYRTKYCY